MRLAILKKENLSEAQTEVWNAMMSGKRAEGRDHGAYLLLGLVLLHDPSHGSRSLQRISGNLRGREGERCVVRGVRETVDEGQQPGGGRSKTPDWFAGWNYTMVESTCTLPIKPFHWEFTKGSSSITITTAITRA